MNRQQIDSVFTRAYRGQGNFMTPTVLNRGEKGQLIYELSEGVGIWTPKMYGVTVLTTAGEKRPELSTCFVSMTSAMQYIEELEGKE